MKCCNALLCLHGNQPAESCGTAYRRVPLFHGLRGVGCGECSLSQDGAKGDPTLFTWFRGCGHFSNEHLITWGAVPGVQGSDVGPAGAGSLLCHSGETAEDAGSCWV